MSEKNDMKLNYYQEDFNGLGKSPLCPLGMLMDWIRNEIENNFNDIDAENLTLTIIQHRLTKREYDELPDWTGY